MSNSEPKLLQLLTVLVHLHEPALLVMDQWPDPIF